MSILFLDHSIVPFNTDLMERKLFQWSFRLLIFGFIILTVLFNFTRQIISTNFIFSSSALDPSFPFLETFTSAGYRPAYQNFPARNPAPPLRPGWPGPTPSQLGGPGPQFRSRAPYQVHQQPNFGHRCLHCSFNSKVEIIKCVCVCDCK